ncbi:lipid asymmetry maintenance protein MlaB [Marinomonas sp. IMCC 4694]|uniref:STAS domain-containing protein n=1 Tax=Marinomonas sp. IMCC 4694 TaxID=2605432 RepID=UPI001652CFDB|nr:STAS domain-containing protein [Marinomonas sp. IMCC 4694]
MSEMCHWKAPTTLTIYEVSELPDVLSDIATRGDAWSMDLADLSEIDSCGCQLLMLIRHAATLSAKSLEFINVDTALRQQLSLFGADTIFESALPQAESPKQMTI